MAGPLLDIWGDYGQATQRYDTLADLYNQNVDAWNAYVDNTGPQVERPNEADMPVQPIAPMGEQYNTTLGNIDPTEVYQSIFGKSTPDVLSNEAWSLSNLMSPTLQSDYGNVYETGGVGRVNNPLYYMAPNELTTGERGVDMNSQMYGQNPYY